MKTKSAARVKLLERATRPNRGAYVCTVPGCKTKSKDDGFCPTHDGIPLRLLKAHY
ncbi:MAG TPA: hypothetical protein VM287_06630 [Egibacteraceae bacterium]|nr:hypothetical protein [Egibacteraceae bacterium]